MPFPTAVTGDTVVYFDGTHKYAAAVMSDDPGSGQIEVSVNMGELGQPIRVTPYDATGTIADTWHWVSTSSGGGGATTYNIVSYGAIPGAGGQSATTTAFNNIFALISTSYPGETGGLMAIIEVPATTAADLGWYVGDLNPYYGNQGVSLYMKGEQPAGYGAQGGSTIWFNGTSGGTLMDFVAINASWFENLTFRGNTKAKVLVKLRQYWNSGLMLQSASNLVYFLNCTFVDPIGDYNSILVQAGEDDDPPNTLQAADYHFERCQFQGHNTIQGWGFKAVVGGNTKTFSFKDCGFTYLYRGVDFDSGYVTCMNCEGGNIGYDRDDQAAMIFGNATGLTVIGGGMENGATGYHAQFIIATQGTNLSAHGFYFAGTAGPSDYVITAAGPSFLTAFNIVNSRELAAYIAWTPLTNIPLAGMYRTNDSGKYYQCATPGVTGNSGGPTGTGSGITDGSVVWNYVGTGDANIAKIQTPAAGPASLFIMGGVFPYITTPIVSIPVYDGSNNLIGAAIGPASTDFAKNYETTVTGIGNVTGLFGATYDVNLPDFFGNNPIYQNDQMQNDGVNTATGITVLRNDGGVYIITVPAAAVGVVTNPIALCYLSPGYVLEDLVIDVTTGFSGPGVTGPKFEVGLSTGGAADLMLAESVSSTGQIGIDTTQRGSAWSGGRYIQLPLDPSNVSSGSIIQLTTTVTGGSVSSINAGSATIYFKHKRWRLPFGFD
jgi:hypothetical protein